ncbi:GNAT family N-acetyltransferase [Robiginitalea sp. IMCC43444]|uniref:GNAT family N-acetyltransferase n=1 Tax=Robiginitalea sp. IMCC43444 TaxID=3459121 RepID=UPI004042F052
MEIIRADLSHLQELSLLLDGYRVFYEQPSDSQAAKNFLQQRLSNEDSVIFMGRIANRPVGFVQLYPSFSTVRLKRIYTLNDLFVAPAQRKSGIGTALLKKAKAYCIEQKAAGLALETARDNPAQLLYERLGWKKDSNCFHYFWSVEGS